MTAGWAATNTLRVAVACKFDCSGVLPDFMPLAAALRAVREGNQ